MVELFRSVKHEIQMKHKTFRQKIYRKKQDNRKDEAKKEQNITYIKSGIWEVLLLQMKR